jgi:hypothetical protein
MCQPLKPNWILTSWPLSGRRKKLLKHLKPEKDLNIEIGPPLPLVRIEQQRQEAQELINPVQT